MLKPPSLLERPAPRSVTHRGEEKRATIRVTLRTVTPILGGGYRARDIDDVDIVRPATIRGHLRFWWRALHGDGAADPGDLFTREAGIWGRAADDGGGRSPVEVRVSVDRESLRVATVQQCEKTADARSYATWTANQPGMPTKQRLPGLRFEVTLTLPATKAFPKAEVENALRAWILFGGYGSRTRRGLGALTVEGDVENRRRWLPVPPPRGGQQPLAWRKALTSVFCGVDPFALPAATPGSAAGRVAGQTPRLAGAGLILGGGCEDDAIVAWDAAIAALRDFRQAQPQWGRKGDHDSAFARVRGESVRHPGRSNWPEPDAGRKLSGGGTHPLRYGGKAWPRAGFGLPLTFFKPIHGAGEIPEFTLCWRTGSRPDDQHDRLASALILKPMPLSDGHFVPMALWLLRAYPNGEVAISHGDSRAAASGAAFDTLVAPGDRPLFAPLDPAVNPALASAVAPMRLRTAFMGWLASHGAVEVAP